MSSVVYSIMYKNRLLALKVIESFVLIIPLCIIVFLVASYISNSLGKAPLDINNHLLVVWKVLRNFFWYIYLALGAIAVFVFESMKPVDKKRRKSFIKKFVIGFLLLNFSYILAGLSIDLGWVSYYFYLKLTGQPLLTR